MRGGDKMKLVQVLSLIKSGLSPAKISKVYKINKSTLSRAVGKLIKAGCVEKIGYGVWEFKKDLKEVSKRPKGSMEVKSETSFKKQIRGHAFVWKIEFADQILWEKYLKRSNLTNQLICRGKVFRIIINGRKTWLTKKGMIIYEPIDFFGRSSFQVKGTAVFEMDQLVKKLLKKLKIKFRPYKFTTSREHYALVKNTLAKQYNDKKEKLFVYGEDGGVWLWVDHSHGVHELETKDPKINRQIQKWYNSHKKTNFEVTPEFVLKAINQNTKNLDYHAENMRSHVEAVKQLSAGVQDLVKVIGELKKQNV